jgi:hypothetical protein
MVILETITGELTIPEACRRLGIGESRFHVLRNETMQATLETLEPRRLGRPPKHTTPEQIEIDDLREQIRRAQVELEVANIKLDLARIHPGLIDGPTATADASGKKNSDRTRQQCKRQRGKQKRRQTN